MIFEGLDDQFFFTGEAVNDQTEAARPCTDDDYEEALGAFSSNARCQVVETNEGQHLFAQLKHFVIVEAMDFVIRYTRYFDDRPEWNSVQAAPDAEQQRLNAGQRKRNEQAEGCAFSGLAFDFGGTLESFERGLDDVKPHAAAGNFSDFIGGAQARRENQLKRLGLVQSRRFIAGHESAFYGTLDNLFAVQAATVIGNFDYDLVALVVCIQPNRAARRLFSGDALRRRLDSVIGGIAYDVRERLGERVEDAFVEVRILAGDLESNILVPQLGYVANDTREPAKELFDGHHADFHHGFLQFAQDARLEREGVGKPAAQGILRMASLELGDGSLKHRFSDDELADQVHDGINSSGVDSQRILGEGLSETRRSNRVVRIFFGPRDWFGGSGFDS